MYTLILLFFHRFVYLQRLTAYSMCETCLTKSQGRKCMIFLENMVPSDRLECKYDLPIRLLTCHCYIYLTRGPFTSVCL